MCFCFAISTSSLPVTYGKNRGSCPLHCPWAAGGQRSGLPIGCPLLPYMETVGSSVGSPLLPNMKKWASQWAAEWATNGNSAMQIRLPTNTWQFNSAKTIFAFSCPPQLRRRAKLFLPYCRPYKVHQYTISLFPKLHLPGDRFYL